MLCQEWAEAQGLSGSRRHQTMTFGGNCTFAAVTWSWRTAVLNLCSQPLWQTSTSKNNDIMIYKSSKISYKIATKVILQSGVTTT